MSEKIDLLNRSEFVDNVITLVNQLSDIRKGCCFAIEGSWGIGKTFVIEEVEEQLGEIYSEENEDNKYFVFHYNCWQHDYYEEPAVAIISAMISSIQEDKAAISTVAEQVVKAGYEFVGKKLGEIAGVYLENKIGVNLIEWAKEIWEIKEDDDKARTEFDKMFNFSQTIEKVRKNLQEIAEKRTIVIIVDELDRCIPQYAIKVMERLHHIFYGLENVVVIMAIDRKQLEHSVEEMFGARNDEKSIDIEKYLKKFIDFSVVLENGTVNEAWMEKYSFYFERFTVCQDKDFEEVNSILPILFDEIDIRRQEKIIEKANMVHSIICNEQMHISILIFEILYEVLIEWKFGDMKNVAKISDAHYINLEQQVGKERIELLKSFESKSNSVVVFNGGNTFGSRKKAVKDTFWGKVFWYFAEIFNKEENLYIDTNKFMDEMKREVEVAKKYVEFCELVK